MTPDELVGLCRTMAGAQVAHSGAYAPDWRQVAFFVLAWTMKVGPGFQRGDDLLIDEEGSALETSQLLMRIGRVKENLEAWGAVVTNLKNKNVEEWELLRFQMEKAVRRYACDTDSKNDALQDVLIKCYQMLGRMIEPHAMDGAEDVVVLVAGTANQLRRSYDFGSPFYAYAKRMAENELLSGFRKARRELEYVVHLDALDTPEESLRALIVEPAAAENDEVLIEASLSDLGAKLVRLLDLVHAELTGKNRAVTLATLAARSQFWLALQLTGIAPPAGLAATEGHSDTDIATRLGMSENAVRVHRSNAKQRISTLDTSAALILEVLFDQHLFAKASAKKRTRVNVSDQQA